jgi:hypothetical protein
MESHCGHSDNRIYSQSPNVGSSKHRPPPPEKETQGLQGQAGINTPSQKLNPGLQNGWQVRAWGYVKEQKGLGIVK